MNRVFKCFIVFVTVVILSATMSTEVLAATTYSDVWVKDAANNWHAKGPNGSYLKNCWFCDDAIAANGKNVWYLIDGNSNMVIAGLVQDGTGNFYSIETNHNGYYGMLRYKSGTYDCNGQKIYLEFHQAHDGAFGAVSNAAGLESLRKIYGVTSVANINNSNIIYSAAYTKDTEEKAYEDELNFGGGGGGGGGGSSGGGSGGSGGDNSKSSEERKVINEFMAANITGEMNDFEKEMQIIMWMVENIDYDLETFYGTAGATYDSYGSYGALVKKKAVCAGYAGAFSKMAKACGLTVIEVTGRAAGLGGWGGHAWNQIRIAGKWYNVDVTWEDPLTGSNGNYSPVNEYGMWNLRNEYINVTGSRLSADHKWSGGNECNSTDYGPMMVDYYLSNRRAADPSEVRELAKRETEEFYKDKAVVRYNGDVEKTADDFLGLIDSNISNRKSGGYFYIALEGITADMPYKDRSAIQSAINSRINEKLPGHLSELEEKFSVNFYGAAGTGYITPDGNYYLTAYLQFNYATDYLNYRINFVDYATGNTIGTPMLGRGKAKRNIAIVFPEGYTYYGEGNDCEEISGKVRYYWREGISFESTGTDAEVNIPVAEQQQPYLITYIDFSDKNTVIGTQGGKSKAGEKIKFTFPDGYEAVYSTADENIYADLLEGFFRLWKTAPGSMTVYVRKNSQIQTGSVLFENAEENTAVLDDTEEAAEDNEITDTDTEETPTTDTEGTDTHENADNERLDETPPDGQVEISFGDDAAVE